MTTRKYRIWHQGNENGLQDHYHRGEVYGLLGVTKGDMVTSWQIDHLPTGYALWKNLDYRTAKRIAKLLADKYDWRWNFRSPKGNTMPAKWEAQSKAILSDIQAELPLPRSRCA